MKKFIKKYNKILFLISIITLIIVGFVIRTPGILSQNILFLFDNGRDLLYVKKIVLEHDLILIGPSSGGLQGFFHGVWWYYLLTIPYILGHGNPAVATLFMAICSTISVVLASVVIYKISKSYIGTILIAIIFSFSTFSVSTSRFIWNPFPIVWLMPLYFLFVYLFSRQKAFSLPVIALITGFIFSFEVIYGIPLAISLFIFMIIWLFKKDKIMNKIKIILISSLLFSIAFAPSVVFDLRHDFLITKSVTKVLTTGGDVITHKDTEKPTSISERLSLRADDLYTYSIASITNNIYISLLIFAIFVYGLFILFKSKQHKDIYFAKLIIMTLLIPFFVFMTLKYSVWSYYWVGNPPLYSLLIAFIIAKSSKKVANLKIATFLLIALLLFTYNISNSFANWNNGIINKGKDNLSTQLEIVDKIHKDAGSNPFSVYVLTPPVYDYVYRYLFLWKGYYDYKIFPHEDKQKIIYLILEPSVSDPDGKYFKKNVVRTKNKPDKVFEFPGGVRVEKVITDKNEEPVDPNYFPRL